MKINSVVFALVLVLYLSSPATECFSDMSFSLTGSVELETFLNTYEDQDFEDALKKGELRGRFEVNCGQDNIYLFSVINAYFMPRFFKGDEDNDYRYAEEATIYRNLQASSTNSEIAFNELYLNYSAGKYRLRIGNQIYGWGTADTFNPTSYFNPMDSREMLLRDMDEMTTGIPSVSGMFFLDGYTLEAVVAPIHVPVLIPLDGNFWSPKLDEDLYSISMEQGDGLDVSLENVAVGARLSTSLFEADMSFSLYRGPNKDGLLVPYATELIPNEHIMILVENQYDIINMAGVDFSRTFGPVVIMCEAAYSNNMPALVNQDFDNPQEITLPIEVRKTNYLSANIGFNYFVPLTNISFFEFHEGESLFLCEYASSTHFDDKFIRSYLSDLLTFGYRDSFYDGRITLMMAAVFDVKTGSSVLWPQLGYDFQNGLTINVSYADITGKVDEGEFIQPIFFYYKDNDVVALKIRYEF